MMKTRKRKTRNRVLEKISSKHGTRDLCYKLKTLELVKKKNLV